MSQLRDRLAAFVPRTIWPFLREGKTGGRRDGCVLFADVAGFTPLTEGLARIGKEGAEELVRILNEFFEAMIGIAHEEGGDVLRFGGDAMTLFFPGGTASGLRAALRMQAESRRFGAIETRGGTFPLAMKVGISSGSVLLGIVGDDAVGRDYFAAGAALDLSAEAEHHAEKGMIAFCPRSVLALDGGPAGMDILPDGFGLLREPLDVRVPAPRAGEGPVFGEMPSESSLCAFLPPFIREKAALPEGLRVAEHRRTTTLFLAFKGLDYEGDADAGGKVGEAFLEIAGAVRRYGGTVNKVDMGDKGSKALCLFGTPTALERQEEMGCRAAMEILDNRALRGLLQDLKIGVTTAPVFAAYVGCDDRREYTVMGDGINLAARLMSNSFAWKMLASRDVFDQAGDALDFRALDPIFVKGKAEKVPIYRPEGERDHATRTDGKARFIGREDILEALLARFGEVEKPCALALSGEAGVGKTALLGRLRQGLDRRGVRYTLVPLAAYGVTAYMSAWRVVLCACLGVTRADSEETRVEALKAALPEEDREYLPLFNGLLDLNLPETPATLALVAKDRKDLSFAILARLIADQAREVPYGILLDQLESADPASLEFLQVLSGETAGTSLKLLCSVREDAPKAVMDAVVPLEGVHLAPFSPAEIREYFVKIAEVPVPTESLLEFVAKRTHGNPKFIEQVLGALRRECILRPDTSGHVGVDEERLASTAFPETLEGLLLSRIEVLPEAERQLLKSASVLGSSFSVGLLSAVLGEGDRQVLDRVRTLESTGLIRMDNWGSRPYATFGDSLLREALYESLNFAVRRQLHRRAGDFLEVGHAADPPVWPVLARHLDAAGDEARAADYMWKAAEDARARYDNASAFSYYDRFVALCEKRCADPGVDERFRQALLHLGEAYKNLGRLAEADTYCQKILDGTQHLFSERVMALMRIADNHRQRGELGMSLDLYRLAMLQARKLGDTVLEARILVDSSVPLAMSGKFPDAVRQLKDAERIARRVDIPSALVTALMNQGLCLLYWKGDYAGSTIFLRQARLAALKANLRPNVVAINVNLAQNLYESGEYRKALDMAGEGVALAKQFGYRFYLASGLSNLALYQTTLGRWEEASRSAQSALETARQYKMGRLTPPNLHTMGILQAQGGNYQRALELQTVALENFLENQSTGEALSCLTEILAMANQLKLPQFATPSLEAFSDKLAEEARHESKASSLGYLAQRTLLGVLGGGVGQDEAASTLDDVREKALSQGLWLIVAEVNEALVALWQFVGNPEEAARVGIRDFAPLAGRFNPLKAIPFILSLAESLSDLGRRRELGPVLALLRRHEACMDRGLTGIRYHHLLAKLALRNRALSAATHRRKSALAIIYETSIHLEEGIERRAFFSLPSVRAVLRGD